MAQSKSIKAHEYDSIVIGGGLSGLIAANVLESTGRKVALVEALDTLGGTSRAIQTPAGVLDLVLKLVPETDDSENMFQWLESVLGCAIPREVVEEAPINYDDGKFKPFIGFGDQKVATAAEVDAYASTRYYKLGLTPKDWVAKLTEMFTGTLFPQSVVTKMLVEDDFVIELTINGSKRLSGREVIFAASPQQLTRLLPDTHVPGKLKQKLMKGEFFTSVNLDLVHKGKITDSKAVHVLKGANEEPSVGLFHPASATEAGETVQVSQWVTLVPRIDAEDEEVVANAFKQIKRQVKRAYENSLDGLLKERIVVSPLSHGDLVGAMGTDGRWPKLQNLWMISGFMDAEKNLAGTIRQARRTLASIAGEPAAVHDRDTDLNDDGPQPTA
ncbi:MAG: NAD(P)-binding protein [Bdellovibrionota bacterium]